MILDLLSIYPSRFKWIQPKSDFGWIHWQVFSDKSGPGHQELSQHFHRILHDPFSGFDVKEGVYNILWDEEPHWSGQNDNLVLFSKNASTLKPTCTSGTKDHKSQPK